MFSDASLHLQLDNLVATQLRSVFLEGPFNSGEWLYQERFVREMNVSQLVALFTHSQQVYSK